MESWVGIMVAIALIVQVSILAALFFQTRKTMQQIERTVNEGDHVKQGQVVALTVGTAQAKSEQPGESSADCNSSQSLFRRHERPSGKNA